MRISAVNSNYPVYSSSTVRTLKQEPVPVENKVSFISFRAGDKNQALFYGVEVRPYFAKGGVSTILNDMRNLKIGSDSRAIDKSSVEYWNQEDKVFVSPVYNGKEIYNYGTGTIQNVQLATIPNDLPETNPFAKYAGKPFMTNNKNFKNYNSVTDFFKNEDSKVMNLDKQIFILEDVTGEKRTMDFGASEGTEIKLYRVMKQFGKNETAKLEKTRDFLVFTDVPATWKEPYEGGGYASGSNVLTQTWKGDGDARSAKAMVELLPRICEVASEDGHKFDPATIILNDSQGAYAVEYMAEKAAGGEEFWKGKKPEFITHNAGAGYIQRTSAMNMFMNIADKELLSAVENDPEFIKALKQGESGLNTYFASKMPLAMVDEQGSYSPFRNALLYAKLGYMPSINTVSPGYHKALTTDPNLAPGSHDLLKELADNGKFIGIMNAFEDPNMSVFSPNGVPGYYNAKNEAVYTFPKDEIVPEKLRGVSIRRFATMDPSKVNETSVDLAHVHDIKQQNKFNLLSRLDKEILETLEKLKEVPGHEKDYSQVIAGLADKNVKVLGYIDRKYIEEAQKPENNVKVITAWGRVDAQKALDSVLRTFENYVNNDAGENDNTLLVMGGELIDGNPEADAIKKIIARMSANPKLRGRFAYLNGFAPNKPLAAAADFAIFPSRFAPCELTDLEARKMLCPSIVTNCQGLADKNFDEAFEGEAERVTGYKTVHAYDMPIEVLDKELSSAEKEQMHKDVDRFLGRIKNEQLIKHGKTINNEEAMKIVRNSDSLHYEYEYSVLRPYRDSIIERELEAKLARAVGSDYTNEAFQEKLMKNLINSKTDWEHNEGLNGGKSSGATYRELFNRDAAEINEKDTLLSKIKEKCQDIIEKEKEKAQDVKEETPNTDTSTTSTDKGFWTKVKEFCKTKKGKWTIAIVAVVAAICAGLAICKNSNKSKPASVVEGVEDKDNVLNEEV